MTRINNRMNCADLHIHTLFSDGTSTVEEVVEEAEKAQLAAIAITDHDTVEALDSAVLAGQAKNIEVLSGLELSAEHQGLEIHLLGYLFDYKNKALLGKLDFLKKVRIERIYQITYKLKKLGLDLNPERVFEMAGEATVGRLHVARTMVKEGLVNSTYEAFNRFIGDRGPAYVANFKVSPKEAIELIRGAGGIPVLAHPYTLNRHDLIPFFVSCGLMGLEVYYPEHNRSMVDSYLNLARKFNLLVTGGSDYHGRAKPEVLMGASKVPYELVEKLKEAKSALK